jgi:hypothetical protein
MIRTLANYYYVVLGIIISGVLAFLLLRSPNREMIWPARVYVDLRSISDQAMQIYVITGVLPETMEQVYSPRDSRGAEILPDRRWRSVPRDPFGKEYLYSVRDRLPVIRFLGRDNWPGGIGQDEDWEWPRDMEKALSPFENCVR